MSLSVLFGTASLLLALYAAIMTFFSTSLGYSIATGVTFFYLLVILMHFMPITAGADSRSSFYRLFRAVLLPSGIVSFPEVLLADALTSISKALKDFGTYLVVLYAAMQGKNSIDYHDRAMIVVAVLASLPFL